MRIIKLTQVDRNHPVWINADNVAYWRDTPFNAYGHNIGVHAVVVFTALAGGTHEDGFALEMHVRESALEVERLFKKVSGDAK